MSAAPPPTAKPRGRLFGSLASILAVLVTIGLLGVVLYTFINAAASCAEGSQGAHPTLLCGYGGLIMAGVLFLHVFLAVVLVALLTNRRFGAAFRAFVLILYLGYAVALGATSHRLWTSRLMTTPNRFINEGS